MFVGADEDVLIWRASTREVEAVRTPGIWLGAKRRIRSVTIDTTLKLEEGDLLCCTLMASPK